MSNQGLRQETARDFSGSASTYEGDFHALFDAHDIPAGTYNGRLLQYINAIMDTEYTNLPGAMAAFATENGSPSWNELGAWIEG